MNDELLLLASAYLDDDVTADERAIVEADAKLLAEVERLRIVRALLADVAPAPISVREQQLAASLDAWDRLSDHTGVHRDATPAGTDGAVRAGAASITAPPASLANRRRSAMNRRLLGAAAAIVIVLGGGIALQTLTSGSDDDSASDAPASEQTDQQAASLAEAAPQADADAGGAIESGDADEKTDSTQLDTGILSAAPPAETDLERLDNPEELAIFASDAVGAPSAPDVPAATSAPVDDRLSDLAIVDATFPLCLGADLIVGPALYRDTVVVVAIIERRDLAVAYEAETCREVARAQLP